MMWENKVKTEALNYFIQNQENWICMSLEQFSIKQTFLYSGK